MNNITETLCILLFGMPKTELGSSDVIQWLENAIKEEVTE